MSRRMFTVGSGGTPGAGFLFREGRRAPAAGSARPFSSELTLMARFSRVSEAAEVSSCPLESGLHSLVLLEFRTW